MSLARTRWNRGWYLCIEFNIVCFNGKKIRWHINSPNSIARTHTDRKSTRREKGGGYRSSCDTHRHHIISTQSQSLSWLSHWRKNSPPTKKKGEREKKNCCVIKEGGRSRRESFVQINRQRSPPYLGGGGGWPDWENAIDMHRSKLRKLKGGGGGDGAVLLIGSFFFFPFLIPSCSCLMSFFVSGLTSLPRGVEEEEEEKPVLFLYVCSGLVRRR